MCGLVGMAGDLGGNFKRVFEELLTVDVLRGPHSTGVAVVNRKGETSVVKDVGPPQYVYAKDSYREAMRDPVKCLIGHNRYATVGKVSPENAHPFDFENVVGAHNGSIELFVKRKMYDTGRYDTDSESIFSNINKYGLFPTLDTLTESKYARNAWALVWYDKVTGTINMTKNSERPLYYCYSEDECTIFWASELEMLKWILRRNNVKVNGAAYYNVLDDVHYSWAIPEKANERFKKPRQAKHEPPPEKETPPWHSFRSEWNHGGWPHSGAQSVIPFKPKKPASIDTKKWRPPYKKPNGMAIKKSLVEGMVKEGCIFCNDFDHKAFKWGDFIFPLKEDLNGHTLFLCEDCYNDEDIRDSCKEMM